jgi:hypothetical protein
MSQRYRPMERFPLKASMRVEAVSFGHITELLSSSVAAPVMRIGLGLSRILAS